MFAKSEFSISISVLDTRYKYCRSQNTISFYSFDHGLDDVLANYFTELKTTKHNIDNFLFNLLIKLNIKTLLYCNVVK